MVAGMIAMTGGTKTIAGIETEMTAIGGPVLAQFA